MKKLLLTCSALVATTSVALADHNTSHKDPSMMDNMDFNGFYIGGDIGYVQPDYDSTLDALAEDSLPMFNAYMGYDFNDALAIEWGGFLTTEEDRNVGGVSTDAKEYGVFVDMVGTHPLGYGFDAIGSVGLQYSKLKVSNSTTDFDESELAPRLGAGVEYQFTDRMRARGMVRYVFSDYDGQVSDTMHYTVGLNYRF
jgi:OOP family OmpA-OmpF porin